MKLSDLPQFMREVKIETKKVTYPSRKDTIQATQVVLGVVFVIGLYLFFVDTVLSWIIGLVL